MPGIFRCCQIALEPFLLFTSSAVVDRIMAPHNDISTLTPRTCEYVHGKRASIDVTQVTGLKISR